MKTRRPHRHNSAVHKVRVLVESGHPDDARKLLARNGITARPYVCTRACLVGVVLTLVMAVHVILAVA